MSTNLSGWRGWARLVVGLWLGIIGFSANGLDPETKISQYLRTNWTPADGLPQSTVYCGLQTADGFMWLGTQEGLTRFDGRRFEVFNRGNTQALRNHNVYSLFEDGMGRLWIGTQRGLFVRENGAFRAVDGNGAFADILVWTLVGDSQNRIWVGTEDQGLLVVENGDMKAVPNDWGMQRETVFSLLQKAPNELWVGGSKGLCIVKDQRAHWLNENDGYDFGAIYFLTSTRSGDLWMAGDPGLIRYKDGQFKLFQEEDGLDSNIIYSIHQDLDDNIWVGTDSGLNRLHAGQIEVEQPDHWDRLNPINSIWEDREGNLWVGRSNDGLFRYCDVAMTTFAEEEGMGHNIVLTVVEDHQGRMIFGTDRGVSFFDGESFKTMTVEDGLADNKVRALAVGPDGAVWVGSTRGVVSRILGDEIKHFDLGLGGRPHNYVRALNFDHEGRLWVGSETGIELLENNQFSKPDGPLGLEANRSIRSDSMGTVWVSTSSRVGYYENGDPQAFRELSLPKSAEIICFHKDGRQRVWMGTYGEGLWRFDGANVMMITHQQGLFDNTIFSILEDNGFLWMSSNRGIFKVPLEDLNAVAEGRANHLVSENFGTADGMKSAECNGASWPAAYRSQSGHFWYPTTWGAVRVNPDNPRRQLPPLAVHFMAIQAGETSYENQEPVRFSSGPNQLAITYTAPSFRQPEKLKFRYRLVGFDEQWHYPTERRTAFYNHLPPGSYDFEVVATYGKEPWAKNPKTIAITVVKSGWWFSIFGWGLGIAIFVGLLIYYWIRIYQVGFKKKCIKELVEQAQNQVRRLEGSWNHLETEYLDTIIDAGLGEMAGKVLQTVNQGLGDIQHRILRVEGSVRSQNIDQRLRIFKPRFQLEQAYVSTGGSQVGLKGDQSVEELARFVKNLKPSRGQMLEQIVAIRDEIHAIGEMVEVQQDYAILENRTGRISLSGLVSDVLRMHGPFLAKHQLTFRREWRELPPIKIHILKLFLTLCGMVRHIAMTSTRKSTDQGEGLIQIKKYGQEMVEINIYAPIGERVKAMNDPDSKLSFLKEVQWLMAAGSEGGLTPIEAGNRQGFQITMKTDSAAWHKEARG